MDAREGRAREKEHFVFRLRKYAWERKENLLNKIKKGKTTHASKILEPHKIMYLKLFAWELKTFFGQYKTLS